MIEILPFDADTIEFPFTSRLPPSCGVESYETFDIPDAETTRSIVPSLS